jgi:regulatory protein
MIYKKPDSQAEAPSVEQALSYAFLALSQRALSERELRQRLAKRNAEADTIEAVIERLQQLKYLNDSQIAERAVQSQHKHGSRAIAQKLRMRGIDAATIEEALEERTEEEEIELAKALLERNARKFTGERAKAKAYALLARRGFSGRVVALALADFDFAAE